MPIEPWISVQYRQDGDPNEHFGSYKNFSVYVYREFVGQWRARVVDSDYAILFAPGIETEAYTSSKEDAFAAGENLLNIMLDFQRKLKLAEKKGIEDASLFRSL